MAIYHFEVKIISRSKGRSSVGASAYRSGEKLYNERDGIEHDYTKKKEVVFSEIQAQDSAPEWCKNREKLWNEVEKVERRKDSQLAREINIALPKELNREQQIELIREYTKENFVDKGMIADVAIHDKQDGNPHAHIMLTVRPISENGEWGPKSKEEHVLDKEGNKIKLRNGNYKSKKVDVVDWNRKETLERWRENWAKTVNKKLEKYGHEERIDHRSYEEQGINKIPTKHEGVIARQIDKRGGTSIKMLENEKIRKENEIIEGIDMEIEQLNKIQQLQKQEMERLREEENELLSKERAQKEEKIKDDEKLKNEEHRDRDLSLDSDFKDMQFKYRDKRADKGEEREERGSITSLEGDSRALNEKVVKSKEQEAYRKKKVELQDLNNTKHTIEQHENRIKLLEKQKEETKGIGGLFKLKERKQLEHEINRSKDMINKQEEFLKEQYNISLEKLDGRIEQINNEIGEISRESIKDRIEKANKQVERNKQQDKPNKEYDRGR
ncbi:MAG: MobQ family relaxase [Peptostreptococcaceae bacterium]|nr:MobQ family relaxase [Peptostreptococcaceae bacterium]